MLDHFGRAELKALVASEGGPHLSIYLPTHTSTADSQQDVIRLKNFIHEAETQLADGWMRNNDVRQFLEPLTKLLHDETFFAKRQSGLAIFLAEGQFLTYRLGLPFKEKLSISRDFLVRPLVPAIHQKSHGFVLALSEHNVALYEVDEGTIHQVEVVGLPVNMETTLNLTSVDRGQQMHSGASTRMGKTAQIYHGQGGMPDSHRDDLKHFFRAVDEAIVSKIGDSSEPMLLACVDSSVSTYHEVNSYKGLHKDHLSGNVDYLSLQELHKKTLPILKAEQALKRLELTHKIREHLHTSTASANAAEVVLAAFQGRIHTFFFDENAIVEGQFDPIRQMAVVYPDDEGTDLVALNTDLVELALEQTLQHKGDVYSVSQSEMPEQAPMAALFRY